MTIPALETTMNSILNDSNPNVSTMSNSLSSKTFIDQWLEPSIFSELKTYLSTIGTMNVTPSSHVSLTLL